jgi:hypothetical protein
MDGDSDALSLLAVDAATSFALSPPLDPAPSRRYRRVIAPI